MTESSSRAHPFLRFMAATDRARHPQAQASGGEAAHRPGVFPPQKNCKNFPVEHKLNRSSACIHVAMPFGVREKVKDCCATTGHIGPLARTLMKTRARDLILWPGQ
jgi:hypothetical protein